MSVFLKFSCKNIWWFRGKSTARCILVLSPLLSGTYPDFHPLPLLREDVLWYDLRRSWAIHNPAHLSGFPAVFPRCLFCATEWTSDGQFPISRNLVVHHAKVLRCAEPKNRVNKAPVILGNSIPPPLPPLSRQMRLQQRPYLITYVMSVIGSFHFFSLFFLWLLSLYHIWKACVDTI